MLSGNCFYTLGLVLQVVEDAVSDIGMASSTRQAKKRKDYAPDQGRWEWRPKGKKCAGDQNLPISLVITRRDFLPSNLGVHWPGGRPQERGRHPTPQPQPQGSGRALFMPISSSHQSLTSMRPLDCALRSPRLRYPCILILFVRKFLKLDNHVVNSFWCGRGWGVGVWVWEVGAPLCAITPSRGLLCVPLSQNWQPGNYLLRDLRVFPPVFSSSLSARFLKLENHVVNSFWRLCPLWGIITIPWV